MSFGIHAVSIAVVVLGMTARGLADVPQEKQHSASPLIVGLDHIPLAVSDLESAAERYRELGFTLKPGRPHDNGIRNAHIKFGDGTEIELINARETRDPLTIEYLKHLAHGDGPAFVSFFTPHMNRLAGHFDAEGKSYKRSGGLISFPEGDELRYLFFGQRINSPTDRPEHFVHENSAEALIGVWIACNGEGSERTLLAGLGIALCNEIVHVPEAVQGVVARLPQGEVVLLPGSRRLVPGRPILGATVRVRSLKLLQRVLAKRIWKPPPVVQTKRGASIFLAPDITHGIWLEFRQQPVAADIAVRRR